MARRLILAALFAALPVSLPHARQDGPARTAAHAFDRAAFEIPHEVFVLDNGLTLLVHEDRSVPVVAVNMWYHVGSRNERPGRTGFAHLFEHFFFNGSEHHPTGFREAMDDLGAVNRNGTTSTDRTNFFQDVPVPALERTLYLEADRMGFLAAQVNQAMLDRERGVVQNEKRQRENQPYGRVYPHLVERIYPAAHPYSWPVIGRMEDLEAATLDDVHEWYRTYYGPNNSVIALAGDISPARALELVQHYFGDIPPVPPLTRTEAWVPRLDANLRERMEDRVPQARLYRVYHAPAWRDAALQPLELFTEVLSGSRSARLDRRLVYEQDLATTVTAFVSRSELASLLVVVATIKEGVSPDRVEAEMDRVIDDLVREGPTGEELLRARSRLLASFARGTENLGGFGGRSDVLAESLTFDGRTDAYLDRLEQIATTRPEQVQAATRVWLTQPHYTLVVTPFPDLRPDTSSLDRTVLPPLGDAPDVQFPAIQRATLDNGLQVLLLERRTAPLVHVTLAVDAGYAADAPARAGAASLALELLSEGTVSRDTFAIVDALDAAGARITTSSTLDLSLVRLQALSPALAPALEIFAEVVRQPSFPQDLVALARDRRLAQIRQEQATPTSAAYRLLAGLLYGPGHAYGNPITGTGFPQTVAGLTRDDLVRWHRDWFHPNQATLIVTGDVSMGTLRPALDEAFGDWRPGTAPSKSVAPVPATRGGHVYLIDRPGADQSVIVAAHVSERGGHVDDLAIETVMRNFGGLATSRLNRNLRLDKGWSYGTSGQLVAARGQRPFIVTAPVQTDRTSEAIRELVAELRGIAGARPIAGEEFASLMRTQTLGLPGRFATLASLDAAATQIVNYGYPDDHFATYARRVRTLDERDLDRAAQTFIRPDEVVWVIVGDLSRVEAGIRALELGIIERVDAP
jgi:zinc protease